MKEILLKFWKPIAALLGLVFAFFVYRNAKSEGKAEKHDTKEMVDQTVESLKPKTDEVVKAIESINTAKPAEKETGEGKDLAQLVDTYNKE